MDRLVYVVMSGAKWTMERQASVAHNLANASSTGYRAEEHKLRAVNTVSDGLPTRSYAVEVSVGANQENGPLQLTSRPLDVAIKGDGWFAVQGPQGEGYTRNGHFQISPEGVLQTANGLPVLGDGGEITIPPDNNVSIGDDGTISVVPRTGSKSAVNAVGRLKLVNPQQTTMMRGDDGLFRTTTGAPEQDDKVRVAGGYLEGSNVNVVDQMVQMIALSRQFEMQTKMLQTAEADDRAAQQILNNRS